MQNNNGPQNFNNQNYNSPKPINNKQPKSGLGIVALILSILGCTFVIGGILAIIDITKNDGKNKLLSKISLGICGFWLLIGIIGSIGKKNDKTQNSTEISSEIATEQEAEETTIAEVEVKEDDSKTKLQEEIKDELSLNYFGNVENDTTGDWRYSGYSENDSQETFASRYYKAFFEDDKEIHAVINFTNKTTAKLSVVGDKIDVTIHEYVDGEEHDAKELFSGDVLKQYLVNISDGSIEEVSDDQGTESSSDFDFIIDPNDMGDYGFENTLNAGTEFEEKKIMYRVPAGTYKVKNIGEYAGGVSVYSDETHITSEGWEEPADVLSSIRIEPNEEGEITVQEGYYIEINVTGKVAFTKVE